VHLVTDILRWRQCRLQLAVVHLYFGPQLEINSTAGRPSGWALPHILVDQDLVVNFATYMRVYTINPNCLLWFSNSVSPTCQLNSNSINSPTPLYSFSSCLSLLMSLSFSNCSWQSKVSLSMYIAGFLIIIIQFPSDFTLQLFVISTPELVVRSV